MLYLQKSTIIEKMIKKSLKQEYAGVRARDNTEVVTIKQVARNKVLE